MASILLKNSVTLLLLRFLFHVNHVAAQTCGGAGTGPPLPPPRHMSQLSEYSLSGVIHDGRIHAVLFYVPNCPNSKRALPQFQEMADNLKDVHPQIALGRLDCDPEGDFCEATGLTRLPAIVLYYQGKQQILYKPDFFHIEMFQPFTIKYAHTLRNMTAKIAAPRSK